MQIPSESYTVVDTKGMIMTYYAALQSINFQDFTAGEPAINVSYVPSTIERLFFFLQLLKNRNEYVEVSFRQTDEIKFVGEIMMTVPLFPLQDFATKFDLESIKEKRIERMNAFAFSLFCMEILDRTSFQRFTKQGVCNFNFEILTPKEQASFMPQAKILFPED